MDPVAVIETLWFLKVELQTLGSLTVVSEALGFVALGLV